MKYTFPKVLALYQDLLNERSEWEAEWRQLSKYLVPGRGVYQTLTKPRKRKLTSTEVINTAGEDALYVLTSGLHGGLTSPSRPWFTLEWDSEDINKVDPLKAWLQDCQDRLHTELQRSNFYSVVNSFYVEYAGFGTGVEFIGEDSDVSFKFDLLTAGEYSFATDSSGKINTFIRTFFMTPSQMVERFPDTCSDKIKLQVKEKRSGVHERYITIIEVVYKEEFQKKPWTQVFYELTSNGRLTGNKEQQPLETKGFYEMPYKAARWSTIGQDVYGIGPGSRALSDIKRLQEMEKSFLMATHKSIDPPLNAPARMRGKLNTLPGGYNFYANPNEKVEPLYSVKFDYNGVGTAVDRVEQRIQRNFFNDIFLTGSRDPNASPLKAKQVDVQEQEKMLRLGPVIERLQHEFFQPLIERCFNIMHRKGKFQELSPELEEIAGEYNISLVSPLAAAQRGVALQGINAFLGFVANGASIDQSILDNINMDEATREYADISGVHLGILRPQDEVQQLRQQRAKAQAAQQKKEEAMQMAQVKSQMDQGAADAMKTQAQAGQILTESVQSATEAGMI